MISDSYNALLPRVRAGGQLSASAYNRLCNMVDGMRGEDGITVWVDSSGIVIRGGGAIAGVEWRIKKINNASKTADIAGGWLVHGTKPHEEILATTVSVVGGTLGSPSWVVLEYQKGARPVILPQTWSIRPTSTPSIYRKVLHGFYEENGRIRHLGQMHFGDVEVSLWP